MKQGPTYKLQELALLQPRKGGPLKFGKIPDVGSWVSWKAEAGLRDLLRELLELALEQDPKVRAAAPHSERRRSLEQDPK